MAKDKKASKAAAAAPKPAQSKPLDSVKAGRVSKAVESSKSVAKKAAKEVEKKKKKTKEPSPEPSSESDEGDDTSASSASSEDDSEVETKAQPKTNGKAAAANDESDSDDSSASDSEDEKAPKAAAAAKVNGNAKAAADSDDDSSSASDDEDEAPKANGKIGETSDSEDSSEASDSGDSSDTSDSDSDAGVATKAGAVEKEDDSDASGSDDSEDDSEDSEEEEVKPKKEEPSKKRKAEESVDKTPKKTKVMVEGEEKEASANLFIGNLSWNVDEEWLTREFEEFGEIKGVRIITDRDSGRSKGFGYVEFTDISNAIKALEDKTGTELDGRNIRIDFSLPRPQKDANFTPQQRSNDRASKYGDTPSQPSTTLFVGNIPFDADESALTEAFQDFGSIKSVRIPTDRDSGEPKGFGYVEFDSIEEAKAAHEGMSGQAINGRTMRLDFAGGRSNDSPRGGFGGRGGGRGRGGFDRGGRGGGRGGSRGGFGDRGRGDRGRGRGGFNRGGFGDFSGKKTTF